MAEEIQRHKRGGIYFDDFEVGNLYEHPLHPHRHADGQHVVLQHDAQPAAAAHRPPLLRAGDRVGPAADELAVHARPDDRHHGQSTSRVGTTIANLGMTEVKFPNPLFEGDTVHCTTEVISKRESTSRPGAGIVEFHHTRLQSGRQQARGRMPPPGLHAHAAEVARRKLCARFCSFPADGGSKLDKAMAAAPTR